MLCDPTVASYSLNYRSLATLFKLISTGLLDDLIEMEHGQLLLRMGTKGKSPILAKRVTSLVSFRGGHELFIFEPNEAESLQEIRDHCNKKRGL